MKLQKLALLMVLMGIAVPSYARMLDVMIFAGAKEEENNNPVEKGFHLALCEQSQPCIVASGIFSSFLERYYRAYVGHSIVTESSWRIYTTKDRDWYLFIPTRYYESLMTLKTDDFKAAVAKDGSRYSPEEILTGFRIHESEGAPGAGVQEGEKILTRMPVTNYFVDIFARLKQEERDLVQSMQKLDQAALKSRSNFDSIRKEISDKISKEVPRHPAINVNHLISIFTQGTTDVFGMWNIYLTGHGAYAALQKDVSAGRVGQLDSSGAKIAGFTIPEFRRLISFFAKIKGNFCYISSCYGGDYNLLLPYMPTLLDAPALYGTEPNFTIAVGSLTSEAVSTKIVTSVACATTKEKKAKALEDLQEMHGRDVKLLSYKDFFARLHEYAQRGKQRVEQKEVTARGEKISTISVVQEPIERVLYHDAELRAILDPVTPRTKSEQDPYGLSALAHVIFPRTKIPRVIPLTDKISVIYRTTEHEHESQGRPFDFVDKEAILPYPAAVLVPINITVLDHKAAPGLVAMEPGITLHSFVKITSNMTFTQFIKESLGATQPVFTKCFYVQELTVVNDASFIPDAPRAPVTFYNVFVVQKENDIRLIFTGPDRKTVYKQQAALSTVPTFGTYTYAPPIPLSASLKVEISLHQVFSNKLLNTLYNYFYQPEDAGLTVYVFWHAIQNYIISQHDHEILRQQSSKQLGISEGLRSAREKVIEDPQTGTGQKTLTEVLKSRKRPDSSARTFEQSGAPTGGKEQKAAGVVEEQAHPVILEPVSGNVISASIKSSQRGKVAKKGKKAPKKTAKKSKKKNVGKKKPQAKAKAIRKPVALPEPEASVEPVGVPTPAPTQSRVISSKKKTKKTPIKSKKKKKGGKGKKPGKKKIKVRQVV